jgi:class 3 adenylate cyclase
MLCPLCDGIVFTKNLISDLNSKPFHCTELYEKTGDIIANNLVQAHFDLLKDTAKKFKGTIIKTIGDAIMASFSHPLDALEVASEMVGRIKEMNSTYKLNGDHAHDIAIKLGLHAGTALVVSANDILDYFGQTINITARVKGLANAGEIWFTENGFAYPKIKYYLEEKNHRIEKSLALLKEVSSETPVYRYIA